ncbi:MAG: class I SAM-dependent methyltransferase [Rhodobacteraceae bacterium]|nr:class I SAM-dependent methyltransferase [Paracoccaceae bacterium]
MADRSDHWNAVFGARADTGLSWFEAEPALSLGLIAAHAAPGDPVLDAGGGTARLVDALLDRGLGPVSVLDVSSAALAAARARLGPRADAVRWIEADLTRWVPDATFAVWHDRAVFHFLTDPAERAAYVAAMDAALRPGGTAILMTFAEDGPESCSGLPVARWSSDALAAEIGRLAPGRFRRIGSRRHMHVTPAGRSQSFQATLLRKRP